MSYTNENIEKFIAENIDYICKVTNGLSTKKCSNNVMDYIEMSETKKDLHDILNSTDNSILSFILPNKSILCVYKENELNYWNGKKDEFKAWTTDKKNYMNFSLYSGTYFDMDFITKFNKEWKDKKIFIVIPTTKKFKYPGNKDELTVSMIIPYDMVECKPEKDKQIHTIKDVGNGILKETYCENNICIELYKTKTGKKIELVSHKNNILHGIQQKWYQNNVLKELSKYKNGNLIYNTKFDENGYMSVITTYYPDNTVDIKTHYLNSRNCIKDHTIIENGHVEYYKKYRDHFLCSKIV